MLYVPGRLVSSTTGEVYFPRCYMRVSPEGYFSTRSDGQPGNLISKYADETFHPFTLIEGSDADSSSVQA